MSCKYMMVDQMDIIPEVVFLYAEGFLHKKKIW